MSSLFYLVGWLFLWFDDINPPTPNPPRKICIKKPGPPKPIRPRPRPYRLLNIISRNSHTPSIHSSIHSSIHPSIHPSIQPPTRTLVRKPETPSKKISRPKEKVGRGKREKWSWSVITDNSSSSRLASRIQFPIKRTILSVLPFAGWLIRPVKSALKLLARHTPCHIHSHPGNGSHDGAEQPDDELERGEEDL